MTEYLPRELSPRLERALRQLPLVVLSGLRQSGKSTLLQSEPGLARNHRYRTLKVFAIEVKEAVELADRLFAIPLGHLLA